MLQKYKATSFRFGSLRYALSGILTFFRQEANAKIHLAATALVVLLIIIIPVSKLELIALVIVTGLVWIAEMINTAIEEIMDHLSPRRNHAVKQIKDIAAGAVLLSAFTALITALLIFIPKLYAHV